MDLSKFQGEFTCIESKLKQMPIIGFDTEDDSKGTPTLFAFFGDFSGKSFWTKNWEAALDFIYDEVEKPSIFIAHNLEYDIGNLFKAQDYILVDEMIYASKLLKVTLYGTSHYFINSSCFCNGLMSLKQIGKIIGIEKIDGDALDTEYVTRDAEIVYEFTKRFQKKLIEESRVNLGITIGQMAMNSYRRSYMMGKKQPTYNSPNCLKAYYGGRVEIFYKGTVENVHVVDINSCYPKVMRDFPYPDTGHIEPSTLKTHEYGIGHFKVKVPEDMKYPPLPYKRQGKGRLYFPVGEFEGWWTYCEMRYAISLGVEVVEEIEGEGTNAGCFPFRNFIDDFYDKRLVAKKNKDSFEVLFYKLFMNNLYGKWCQHNSGAKMTRDKLPYAEIEKWVDHPDFKMRKIGPFYSYEFPKLEPPRTANFLWGIYVTSYARIYLHRGIMDVAKAGCMPLYCDTDSIMYSFGSNGNAIPVHLSDSLGDWSHEKFDLGIFRVSKGYLLCNDRKDFFEISKVACKGVPTHLAYDFILKGMAVVQKPFRFKEALISMNAAVHENDDEFLQDIGINVWRDVIKEMRSIDIKRHGKIGETRPINASEIVSLEKQVLKNDILDIEQELLNDGYKIKKPSHTNKFTNTRIPDGWFDGYEPEKNSIKIPISNSIHFFKENECLSIECGQIWFSGIVLGYWKSSKGVVFYRIYCENFKGKTQGIKFLGAIFKGFLDNFLGDEKIIGKRLAIYLRSVYIEGRPLDLRVEISDSDYQGPFDEEIPEEDGLTKQEKENLLACDWSFTNEFS